MTARVVWLVANFAANLVLLYGAAGYLADGSRLPLLVAGALASGACVLALSRPTPPRAVAELSRPRVPPRH